VTQNEEDCSQCDHFQRSAGLDRLFEMSLDMLCVADTAGKLVNCNPAWSVTLGWSQAELLAMPSYFSLIHQDDLPATQHLNEKFLDGHDSLNFTCRVRCKDNSYKTLQWNGKSVPGGVIYAVARDITDQHAERQKLMAVLAAIPHMVFELDSDGRYLFYHADPHQPHAAPSSIVGSLIHDLLPKSVADLSMAAVSRALESRDPQVIRYSLPDKQNRVEFFEAHVGATDRGTVVAVVSNITDHVTQQQIQERANATLEAVNESLEQFVYVASHDLREPLIGVAGFATLLNRRYGDQLDDQGQHFLEEVLKGCKRMEAKIDDLLQLSRAGRGKPNGIFALGAAVEEARRATAGSIRESGATIEVVGALPKIQGSQSEIAQVFQNIFSNSIKYQHDDRTPIIRVKAEPHGDSNEWLISVSDNGIGFDMRHADRIFGVFQRLYTVDQYPGTGIGLAIVKKIIDKYGGRIWPESEPNKGSTFFFTLPKAGT